MSRYEEVTVNDESTLIDGLGLKPEVNRNDYAAVMFAGTMACVGQPMHPNDYRRAQQACGLREDQPLTVEHCNQFLREARKPDSDP